MVDRRSRRAPGDRLGLGHLRAGLTNYFPVDLLAALRPRARCPILGARAMLLAQPGVADMALNLVKTFTVKSNAQADIRKAIAKGECGSDDYSVEKTDDGRFRIVAKLVEELLAESVDHFDIPQEADLDV